MCRMRHFLVVLSSFFHPSPLCTFSCHPSPPSIVPSSLTSSCHLFLGLPLNVVLKFTYNTLLGILFLPYVYCFLIHLAKDFANIINMTVPNRMLRDSAFLLLTRVTSLYYLISYPKFKIFSIIPIYILNLLKPTGYMMHHQFNIQQLYALPTLYLCVLYLSEKKQRLVPLTA